MDQPTIEKLNDDVLLEIFEYLDGTSLKACTTVDKRWLAIIVSTASTMKKLPLWIDNKWEAKQPPLGTVQRNFQSVHSYLAIFRDDKFLSSFVNGASIRHLTLEEVQVSRKCFCQLLQAMINLDELLIDDSWTVNDDFESFGRRESQKVLEKLVLKSHEWEFLKLIKEMDIPVRELKIHSPSSSIESLMSREHLEHFMTSQLHLKSLALDVHCPVLQAINIVENKFELESLYVKHHERDENGREDEELIKLLERHRESLKNLELFMNFSEKSLKHIVKTLKIKRLMLSRLPDCEHLTTVNPNKFLKKLIVTGRLEKLDTLKWLLRNYSDLETLVIQEWTGVDVGEFLDFISDHLKSLQHLELPTVKCGPANNSGSPQMPSLKSVRIEYLRTYEALEALYVRLHAIETLAIKWLPKSPNYDDLVSIAARFPHLRHIKLGTRFEASDRVLEALNRVCPQLRKLEILRSSSTPQVNMTFNNIQVLYYSPSSSKHVFESEKTRWQDNDEDEDCSSDDDGSRDISNSDSDGDSDMDANDVDFDYVQDAYGQGDFGYLFHMFHQR